MKRSYIFKPPRRLILSRADRCTSRSRIKEEGGRQQKYSGTGFAEGAATSSCAIYMVNMPLKAAQGPL